MNVFIFYVSILMSKKNLILLNKALLYEQYHEWMKWLKKKADLI